MRNKLFIILLLFLTNCGYSAIYKNTKSNDLMINIIAMQGDAEINSLIKKELLIPTKIYTNEVLNLETALRSMFYYFVI